MNKKPGSVNFILRIVLLIILSFFLISVFDPTIATAQSLEESPFGKFERLPQVQKQAVKPVVNRAIPPSIEQFEVFINGSFESGDFSGWITEEISNPFIWLQVSTAGYDPGNGLFTSQPVDGDYSMIHGWEGDGPGTIRLAQDVVLPPGTVSLEFDYRAGWDLYSYGGTQSRYFTVSVEPSGGGDPLLSEMLLTGEAGVREPDTGPLHGTVDISAFADSSVRISFDWLVLGSWQGPSFFELDNIYVIPVDSGPRISVIPADHDFGLLPVEKDSKPVPVTIRSRGSESLTISAISDPGSPFVLSNMPDLPLVIPPGGTETFDVTFSPGSVDTFYSTITVECDDPDNPLVEITLTGEGLVFFQADSGVLYASTGHSDGGNLLIIDTETGAGTLVGATGINAVPGLAINSSGDIYGTSADDGNLYLIDAVSGRASLVTSTGLYTIPAISFNADDILYGLGVDNQNGAFNLYTFDLITGEPSLVGPVNNNYSWRGLSFDPLDGAMYGSTTASEILFIDPANGNSTYIGSAGLYGGLPDIQFDNEGTLYGVAGGNAQTGDLYVIDKDDAQASLIGSVGYMSVSGLAMMTERPLGIYAGIVPRGINFNQAALGFTSAARTVTIRSVGTENLTVSGISDPNSPFSLSNVPSLPAVILPGGLATFEVTFSPDTAGEFSDTIAISSDFGVEPEVLIFLSGEGVEIDTALTGVMYGSTGGSSNGLLISIDLGTGEGTSIGETGLGGVPAIAVDSRGYLYGTDRNDINLYLIDADDGTSILIGNTGLSFLPALAFDNHDVLYGLGAPPNSEMMYLYTINTTTGLATEVAPAGEWIYWRGMTFHPVSGDLYACTDDGDLYTIDPASGSPFYLGTLDVNLPDIQFDSDGNLYGAAGGNQVGDLIAIDLFDLESPYYIGSIGFTSVSGLAYRMGQPEGRHAAVFPTEISFNEVGIGFSSPDHKISIGNQGTEDLTVSAISDPGAPFILANLPSLPAVIPAGDVLSFDVTFSPAIADTFYEAITIGSDDPENPEIEVALSGIGVAIGLAEAGVFYGSTGSGENGLLITIDPDSGTGTLVGPTGLNRVPGLAINSSGAIYGVDGDNGDLYLIDADSGRVILIGKTGIDWIPALAFDNEDVLYGLGMTYDEEQWNLYSIDPVTARATVVVPVSSDGDWRGMSFNPVDGELWVSTSGDDIYTLDPATGLSDYLGMTGLGMGMPDIQFTAEGVLYGVAGGNNLENVLTTVDLSSGAATVIGPVGFISVSGLAMMIEPPKVPDITVAPLSVDFSEVIVGEEGAVRTVLISSVGTDTLTVTAISDPGSPFSLTRVPALPLLLAPGEVDTVEITFTPTDPDSATATFSISSNDPDNPSVEISLVGVGLVDGVNADQEGGIPTRFCLHQNYPNPFNPLTTIRYDIPVNGPVKLEVYDLLGRRVTILVDAVRAPGIYKVEWNASALPSGVYFCRIQTKSYTASKKVVLIK